MPFLDIDQFRQAAAMGAWVWVDATGEAVQSGVEPHQGLRLADIGALFVAALREHFGPAASAVAERRLDLHEGLHQPLASTTVHAAVSCAEGAQALFAAHSFMLNFEYSAQLLGQGFVRVCADLGLDAQRLAPEQREALDLALQPVFAAPVAPQRDQVEAELRRQLLAPRH